MNSIKFWNKMDTIFVDSENSKKSDPHRLLLILSDKTDLMRSDKYNNYKKVIKSSKFKTSAPMRNEKIEIPDGSYSLSGIQGYFEYIKKHEKFTDNPWIRIYVN